MEHTFSPPMRMRAVEPTPTGMSGELVPNQYLRALNEARERQRNESKEAVLGGRQHGLLINHGSEGGGGTVCGMGRAQKKREVKANILRSKRLNFGLDARSLTAAPAAAPLCSACAAASPGREQEEADEKKLKSGA